MNDVLGFRDAAWVGYPTVLDYSGRDHGPDSGLRHPGSGSISIIWTLRTRPPSRVFVCELDHHDIGWVPVGDESTVQAAPAVVLGLSALSSDPSLAIPASIPVSAMAGS